MAAAAVGLGGGIISAIGGKKKADAQKAQLGMEALENRQAGGDTLQQAREEEANFRTAARRQLASARAGASASGVSIEGSVAEALGESARNFEADALQIRSKAKKRADAFRRGAAAQKEAGSASTTLGLVGGIAGSVGEFGARGGFKQTGKLLGIG